MVLPLLSRCRNLAQPDLAIIDPVVMRPVIFRKIKSLTVIWASGHQFLEIYHSHDSYIDNLSLNKSFIIVVIVCNPERQKASWNDELFD